MTIFARREIPASEKDGAKILKGEETLTVGGVGTLRRVRLSGWILSPLPVVFVMSTLIPFFGRPTLRKHGFLVFLAFVLTGSMIVYISLGLRYVNSVGKPGEVLSLGFGSIYHGTFVNDVSEEWLFSLTAPPTPAPAADEQQVQQWTTSSAQGSAVGSVSPKSPSAVKGFGAPLWVLLVSVLGAALLTIALIVNEISKRPDPNNEQEMRSRLEVIVRHQFFILFAPLGAVFVYQLLVISETATQPITVALASLGAGASINAILSKGVEYSSGLIQGFGKKS